MKHTLRYGAAGLMLAGALGATAAPASAQGPIVTGGLVNITIVDLIDGDVLSDNNVALGVALGIAANVCDVNANVLAEQLRVGGAECDADATTIASNGPGNGGGSTQQEGLVNVNAEDIVVQIPVALAANVCDVNIGVLARQLRAGGAECDATADAIANN